MAEKLDEKEMNEMIKSTFELQENEGDDKVMPLHEAIERNVKPGMTLFATQLANAALAEVMRQYYGKKPGFTLIIRMPGQTHAIPLVHNGLIKKIVFHNCSDPLPAPSPNPIMQRVYRENSVEFQNQSVLGLTYGVMAGALDIGFMPTKSMVGTDTAKDLGDNFKEIDDPFGSGKRLGLVKALTPDVALAHAWVADRAGNAILPFPGDWDAWGPKASLATVLTVERVVSTDFIRKHSSLVKIPGYMVNSVSVTPLGAHPQRLDDPGFGVMEFEGYGMDDDFLVAMKKASEDTARFDAWIKEWVLDCKSHADYMAKLGYDKILRLKGEAATDSWEFKLGSLSREVSTSEQYTEAEMMMVAASRKITERILARKYKALFPGIGAAAMAGWLSYFLLKREGYNLDLAQSGIGYSPRPGDPNPASQANVTTYKMQGSSVEVHGVAIGGRNSRSIVVMGAGQIDKYGNMNATKMSKDVYLAGTGGGGDVASGARELVIVSRQSPKRFLDKVPFVTYRGNNVKMIISQMGVFEKLGDDNEFTLTEHFPGITVEQIKKNCGWDLKVSPQIKESAPPSVRELIILRLLDPQGAFRLK